MAQRVRLPALAAAAMLAPFAAGAHDEPAATPRRGDPIADSGHRAHETVRLVLLPAVVTSSKGRPVRGLTPEDFRLYDGGEVRAIDFFGTEEKLPVSIAFLLDVSGSMALGERMESAKRAIEVFVGALAAEDRMGLICFADDKVEWVTRFTQDRARFVTRLQVQDSLGTTALYDALAASPAMVDEEVQGRKALILFTDGVDNASRLSTLEAVWTARRVRVPIYVFGYVPTSNPDRLPRRARQGMKVLGRFSSETGGAVFPVHTAEQVAEATAAVLAELRFQYVLGFRPEGEGEGGFRPLRLECGRRGLSVRTRSGYYSGP